MTDLEKMIEAELNRINADSASEEKETPEQKLNEADSETPATTLTEICKALKFKTDGMEDPNLSEIKDSEWNNLFNEAKKQAGQVAAQKAGQEKTYNIAVKKFEALVQGKVFRKKVKANSVADGYIKITDPNLSDKTTQTSLVNARDLTKLNWDQVQATEDANEATIFDEAAARQFMKDFAMHGRQVKGDVSLKLHNAAAEASREKIADYRVILVKAYIEAQLNGGTAQDNLPAAGSPADKIYNDMLKNFANAVINRNTSPLFGNNYITGCINYYNKNGDNTQPNFLVYAAAAAQNNVYDSRKIGDDSVGSTQLLLNAKFYTANTDATKAGLSLDVYKKLADRDRDRLIAKSVLLLPADATDLKAPLDPELVQYLGGDNSVEASIRTKFGGLKFDEAIVRDGQVAYDEMIKNIKDIAKATKKAPFGISVNGTTYEAYKDPNQDNQWMTDEDDKIHLKVGDQIQVTENDTIITGVRLASNDRASDVKISANKVVSFNSGNTEGDCQLFFRVDKANRTASCYVVVDFPAPAGPDHAVVIEGADGNVTIPATITGVSGGKAAKDIVIKFIPTFAAGFEYDACDTVPATLALAIDPATKEISFTMPDEDVHVTVKAKASGAPAGAPAVGGLDALDTIDAFRTAKLQIARHTAVNRFGYASAVADHTCSKANTEAVINRAKEISTLAWPGNEIYVVAVGAAGIADATKVAVIATIKDGNVTVTSDLAAEAAKLGGAPAGGAGA